jgi:hypothetical protein
MSTMSGGRVFRCAVPLAAAASFLIWTGCGMLEEDKSDGQVQGNQEQSGGTDFGWGVEVVQVTLGEDGGFGQEGMPGIVLGPSNGAGDGTQGLDVLSLGAGGAITLSFGDNLCVVEQGGDDLVVLENAFFVAGDPANRFVETGRVALSQDGVNFVEFPTSVNSALPPGDPNRYPGFAGREPVYSGTDPNEVGGDRFDLADLPPPGLSWARYIRITDTAGDPEDPGDLIGPGYGKSGFDLDAVAALHLGQGDECL